MTAFLNGNNNDSKEDPDTNGVVDASIKNEADQRREYWWNWFDVFNLSDGIVSSVFQILEAVFSVW